MSFTQQKMPSKTAQTRAADNAAQIDSSELLDADGRLVIRHRGERYQLRQTRAEKLILTKLQASD